MRQGREIPVCKTPLLLPGWALSMPLLGMQPVLRCHRTLAAGLRLHAPVEVSLSDCLVLSGLLPEPQQVLQCHQTPVAGRAPGC